MSVRRCGAATSAVGSAATSAVASEERGPGARDQDRVTQVVRNAYLAVLGREPDATGLRDYGARVRQDNWSQADIEKALRDSPEYRTKHR